MQYRSEIYVCWDCRLHWDASVIDEQDAVVCPECGEIVDQVEVEDE